MSSRTWVLAAAASAVALGVGGCRGSDDAVIARAEIGPSGGSVSSVDSVLTIAILPGALEETIELTIERSDEPPEVFGPAYRVRPNLDLAIPATVTYHFPLPEDTSQTAVGYVDPEEFAGGGGRWHPLALGRLDVDQEIITGLDPQLSLFYGLLDDAVDVPPNPTTGTGTGTGTGSSGGMDGDTTTGGELTSTTGPDPDTSAGPTSTTNPTTGPGDSSSTGDEGTTTGGVDPCDNLPAGPLMVDEFLFTGTPLDGNSEDLTFSSIGSLIIRDGADLVQIDPGGNVTPIPMMGVLPDTLGIRWTTAGNLVAASLTTNELLLIEPSGMFSQLWGGLAIPNGVYPAIDGNVFFTDFSLPLAAYIDAAGTMQTDLGVTGVEAPQANGIIYDPTRDFVYYVSYGQGILWRVDVTDLANPGDPQDILTIGPTGGGDQVGLDGVAMDVCGNLYIVDQNAGAPGSLFRVELDMAGDPVGGAELLVETFPDGVANAVFGQGPGWEAYDTTLFVVGLPGRIFMVDVGVVGAPTAVTG